MSHAVNREIHLKRRPVGTPTADDFQLVETPMPKPAAEQFLVRNVFMSVDPMVPAFFMEMGQWVREGKIKWEETVVDGIAKAPEAFLGLFTGANAGKMLVRVGPDRVS